MGDGQSEQERITKPEIQKPTHKNSTPLVRGIMPLGERKVRKELEETKQLAQIDPLTHLLNRRGFLGNGEKKLAALPQELAEALRHHTPMSVAYLDLDHLRELNTALGHNTVDEILGKLGEAILSTIRKGEIPARLGGDEFALLLPNTTQEEAFLALQRIQSELRQVPTLREHGITFSIGLTTLSPKDYTEPAVSPINLLNRADTAAYAAKNAGRNRIVAWEEGMKQNPDSQYDTTHDQNVSP